MGCGFEWGSELFKDYPKAWQGLQRDIKKHTFGRNAQVTSPRSRLQLTSCSVSSAVDVSHGSQRGTDVEE